MFPPAPYRWIVAMLLAACVMLVLTQPTTAQDVQEEPTAPEAAPPEPFKVPDGPPEEQIEFIQRVLQRPPANEAERLQAIEALQQSADKILAAKATEDQMAMAVEVKVLFASDAKALSALAEQLEKDGHPKFAREVRVATWTDQLRLLASMPKDQLDAKASELTGRIFDFLRAAPLGQSEVELAMRTAQIMEALGSEQLAVDTYQNVGQLFTASDNPRVKQLGTMMEGVVRRMKLTGHEMKVEGTLLDGQPFDWVKYQGKVVLVNFWATWCGPCRAALPELKELYRQYHEKGFDIVGISLDRNQEELAQFVEHEQIPWPILFDEPTNPTTNYYGVMSVPTMILIDKSGKVITTKARGELRQELEKLFPAAKPDAQAASATPRANLPQ